jgi:hypothetical protein
MMNDFAKTASAWMVAAISVPIALSGPAIAMGGGHGGIGGMAGAAAGATAGLGGGSGLGAGVSASASAAANADASPLSAVTTAATNVSGAIDAATPTGATVDGSMSGDTVANDPSRPRGHHGSSKSQLSNDAAKSGSGHHSRTVDNRPKSTTSTTAATDVDVSANDGLPHVSGTVSGGANLSADTGTQE